MTAIASELEHKGAVAKAASRKLATLPSAIKDRALLAIADALVARTEEVVAANAVDVTAARENGLDSYIVDRLLLDPGRIAAMAGDVRKVADLADPVGEMFDVRRLPNGMQVGRRRVPLGVIGTIYESRPNVTADAGGLCLKAGNAAILRGGSESFHSSAAIHACLEQGLAEARLPQAAIQRVPTRDRAAVGEMLRGLDGAIDVIVPRGGKSLVARVQEEARVPVFAHLEGVCHIYLHAPADLEMARAVTLNAKMRRTGICGAAETLLVDRALAATHLAPIVEALQAAGCVIRGDEATRAAVAGVEPATEADWPAEYLDAIIAVKVVDGLGEAIAHIGQYGSHHTEAIITDDETAAARFMAEVDSAILLHNASTQFADGGEFGMGAEIGIATGKLHARGPVGVEQLTSFKYCVYGAGQTRP